MDSLQQRFKKQITAIDNVLSGIGKNVFWNFLFHIHEQIRRLEQKKTRERFLEFFVPIRRICSCNIVYYTNERFIFLLNINHTMVCNITQCDRSAGDFGRHVEDLQTMDRGYGSAVRNALSVLRSRRESVV